jgi:hypothetical protein
MQRRTVMTSHNSKTYQVDGLTWEVTPQDHIFAYQVKNSEGKKVQHQSNMVEYFRNVYNIKIDKNEPLLFVNFRGERIYLPTSLCYDASLPDDFTKDTRKMRDLDNYKIKDPDKRFSRIESLKKKLAGCNDFKNWNIEMTAEMAKVQGKVLEPPALMYQNKKVTWKDYESRKIPHS